VKPSQSHHDDGEGSLNAEWGHKLIDEEMANAKANVDDRFGTHQAKDASSHGHEPAKKVGDAHGQAGQTGKEVVDDSDASDAIGFDWKAEKNGEKSAKSSKTEGQGNEGDLDVIPDGKMEGSKQSKQHKPKVDAKEKEEKVVAVEEESDAPPQDKEASEKLDGGDETGERESERDQAKIGNEAKGVAKEEATKSATEVEAGADLEGKAANGETEAEPKTSRDGKRCCLFFLSDFTFMVLIRRPGHGGLLSPKDSKV
jgi:hypothetical protein